MSYQFGESRGRLPVAVLTDIYVSDQAAPLREQAARIRALAAESQDLLAARHELALAELLAKRNAEALLTFDERMERAERVRAAAFIQHGYDAVTCLERLVVATNERCQRLWVSQKKQRNQK